MRRLRLAALAVACVVAAAGCAPSVPFLPAGTRTCLAVPSAVCDLQLARAERLATSRGGLTGLALTCRTVCTEETGEASLVVRFGDGSGRSGRFGWSGGGSVGEASASRQVPALAPTCIGVTEAVCRERFRDSLETVAATPLPPVVLVVVSCATTCDDRRGEGETRVAFADAAWERHGWSYGIAP